MINISHELPKCISFTLISDKTNEYGNVGGGKVKPSAEKSKQFIVSLYQNYHYIINFIFISSSGDT